MRGNYILEDLGLVKKHLDPAGLGVQTVLYSTEEVENYGKVIDDLWP